jgi:hypothetical protein
MSSSLKVKLSGGPNRQRFAGGMTKKQVMSQLLLKKPDIDFVTSGHTANRIVIPDEAPNASKTALSHAKEDAQVLTLTEFIKELCLDSNGKSEEKMKKLEKATKSKSDCSSSAKKNQTHIESGGKGKTSSKTYPSTSNTEAEHSFCNQKTESGDRCKYDIANKSIYCPHHCLSTDAVSPASCPATGAATANNKVRRSASVDVKPVTSGKTSKASTSSPNLLVPKK